jgi:hypothetical protein
VSDDQHEPGTWIRVQFDGHVPDANPLDAVNRILAQGNLSGSLREVLGLTHLGNLAVFDHETTAVAVSREDLEIVYEYARRFDVDCDPSMQRVREVLGMEPL